MKKTFLLAGVLAALLAMAGVWSCAQGPASGPSAAGQGQAGVLVTILHINDSHGHTEPYNLDGKSVGGYSRLSTMVSDVRKSSSAARVLLVHAGDVFSRGDALTTRTKGAANVAIFNRLGFDFWTPGNGEYYGGMANLQARIAEANFPVLTANVTVEATGKCLGEPYAMTTAGPVKIAIFGLCFVHTDLPSAKGLVVADPIETAGKVVPELRKRADLVVALTHLGYWEDVKLAGKVEGIDLIIGGHSHTALESGKRVKGPDGREVLICQAGEYLQYLGQIDLKMVPDGGKYKLAEAKAKLTPIDANVPMDATITALIARLAEHTMQPASAKAGKSSSD